MTDTKWLSEDELKWYDQAIGAGLHEGSTIIAILSRLAAERKNTAGVIAIAAETDRQSILIRERNRELVEALEMLTNAGCRCEGCANAREVLARNGGKP